MPERLGEALLYLKTDDRGLTQGIAQAKGKSEQLGRTLDATSGSATRLEKSMDAAGTSSGKFAVQQQAVTKVSGAQRAGLQQLSMQLGDVATMYSLGARPQQIFASQASQVFQAIQLASGGTSKFASFMGGPWGIALTTAAVVVTPLIGKLFESEDAAKKSKDAHETLAEKLDRTKHSFAEVTEAIREYNSEQDKATEITLSNAAAVAKAAQQNLNEAISIREKLKAQLEYFQAEAHRGATSEAGELQRQNAMRRSGDLRDAIAAQDKKLKDLAEDARKAVIGVAVAAAEMDADPTVKIRTGFDLLRKKAKDTITDVAELRKRLADLDRAEKAALDRQRKSSRSSSSSSDRSSLAGMTALIEQLFPGAKITSTTGGKHTKGSDHYKGHAIDFVPAGGMGSVSTAEVERILEAAGVNIRYGKGGTKQIFGPGRSAGKAGDHDDHFHVAWSGSPDPESAQRKMERAAEQEARRQEAYTRDLAGLNQAALDLQQQLVNNAEERYAAERQALEVSVAEQKRRIEASKEYTEAEKATLLAVLEKKASLERELIERRRQEELAQQAFEVASAMRGNERDILEAQSRLAETREERKAVEQRLLDLAYEQERAELQATIASTQASEVQKAIARQRLRVLGQLQGLDQKQLDRDFASPIERYIGDIERVGRDIDDELGRVTVSGLEKLNDGITDAITGAKSLGEAFNDVANQIIADLVRIAIQQAIIKPLAQLLGGGGSGGGGGGFFGTLLNGIGAFFGGGGGGALSTDGGLTGAIVNTTSARLPGFATGGSFKFGGMPGVDKNLLSLNGSPIARVSRGEIGEIRRPGGEAGDGIKGELAIRLGPGLEAEWLQKSAGQTVQILEATGPGMLRAASAVSRRDAARPRTPGGHTG